MPAKLCLCCHELGNASVLIASSASHLIVVDLIFSPLPTSFSFMDTKKSHPRSEGSASKSESKRVKTPRLITPVVDVEFDKWPYCIVWTSLPIVTWFIPIIGHTGVANSKGVIYDFSDDFNVSIDNFSFGTPTKYYQYHPDRIPNGAPAWDKAIQETSDYYSRTRHSLFFNNCHQYIAGVLNKVKYENRDNWTQTEVWWHITFKSHYTGFLGFLRQWWPFAVIVLIFIFLCIVLL